MTRTGAGAHLVDLVRAEVTKTVTHPVTPGAVAAALLAGTTTALLTVTDAVRLGTQETPVPLAALPGVVLAPVHLLLVVAAVAGDEHRSGLHRVTLTVVPHRRHLAVARMVALAVVAAGAAVVALAPARAVLVHHGTVPGPVLPDVARWVAACVLLSVLAHGLAVAARSAAVAVGVLVAVPVLVAAGVVPWPAVVRVLPAQAALGLTGTGGVDLLAPGPALLVLGAWALAAAAVGATALVRRDA